VQRGVRLWRDEAHKLAYVSEVFQRERRVDTRGRVRREEHAPRARLQPRAAVWTVYNRRYYAGVIPHEHVVRAQRVLLRADADEALARD
jgi:hypothetical protein